MGPERPSIWLVSPAFRRYAVTRLALAQRAHLAGVLAGRGIDCHTVIVADDENLDIAREYGFDTVELRNNAGVGRKFNAGYQHAAKEGADWFVHIGSDDWAHSDLFTDLPSDAILTGRLIAFCDLLTGRMSRAELHGAQGVIPWIIPRRLLEPCRFAPIRPERNRGLDGFLIRGLKQARVPIRWVHRDPHPFARVDFKSDVNVNTFARLPTSLTRARVPDPWAALAEHYPAELAERARNTHLELQEAPMPKMRKPNGRTVSVSEAGVGPLQARGYELLDEAANRPPAEESETTLPERPADSAYKPEWVAFAEALGVENADKLTKQELIDKVG